MNPLTPPTDNLYKFMAICGLVLAALGIVVTFNLRHDIGTRRYEVLVDIARLQSDSKAVDADIDAWRRNSPLSRKTNNDSDLPQALAERKRSVTSRDGEMRVKTDYVRSLSAEVTVVTWLFYILEAIGSFCAGLGFQRWYERHQKYEDIIKRCEAEKATIDLNKAKEESFLAGIAASFAASENDLALPNETAAPTLAPQTSSVNTPTAQPASPQVAGVIT